MTSQSILLVGVTWAATLLLPVCAWRIGKRFWGSHVEGPKGYLRDQYIVSGPVMIMLPIAVALIVLDVRGVISGYLPYVGVAFVLALAASFTPPIKRARLRLLRSRYPQEVGA